MSMASRGSWSIRRWRLLLAAVAAVLPLSVHIIRADTGVVFRPQTFTRGTGAPVPVRRTFSVVQLGATYTLRITNHGVTSGVISLNGRTVVGPQDFTGSETSAAKIERAVNLSAGANELIVELRSRPGTSLDVDIIGATAQTPPHADAGGPYTGRVGQPIAYDGSHSTASSGVAITSYSWNFGDNSTGTGVAPTHAYAAAGTYQVSLTVTDSNGATNSASATASVVGLPVASAGGPYVGTADQAITFNGTASTAPAGLTLTSYAWNFGDNATGTGPTPTHAYASANTFQVTLVVTDSGGGTSSATTSATITTPQSPSIVGFTPLSGPIGTLVNVTLANFSPTNGSSPQLTLARTGGGTIAAPVSSVSANALSFVVPAGAATGNITLTSGGQSAVSGQPFSVTTSSTFSVNIGPSTANLIKEQQVTYAVTLNSSTGFKGLATLAVSGVPSGVSAGFKPTAITAGQTSVLTLSAPAGQAIGTSTISVTAAATIDGQDVSKSATAALQVTGITTSFVGRTVVDDAQQTPIAGVSIHFMGKDDKGNSTGCSGQTTSDEGGNFALTNLPTACIGPQLITYDGLTATSPPGIYAGVNLSYTLAAGAVTTSPVLIHLPRIDNAQTIELEQHADSAQVFTFDSLPSVRVNVAPGTTFTLDDGTHPDPFPMVAVEVPVDRLPDATPTSGLAMPFIVAFQPANAHSSQPVAVEYPNSLHLPPGATATLMTLDPTRGYMVPYGTGTVSSDGTRIVPDVDPAHPGLRYGITNFDWHGPAVPPPPDINPGPDSDDGPPPPGPPCMSCPCPAPPNCQEAGPVGLSSGIVSYTALDIGVKGPRAPIFINRVYRTLSANPGPFGPGTS